MDTANELTPKQFEGFVRLILRWLDHALEKSPDNDEIKKLIDILNSMLEDY